MLFMQNAIKIHLNIKCFIIHWIQSLMNKLYLVIKLLTYVFKKILSDFYSHLRYINKYYGTNRKGL